MKYFFWGTAGNTLTWYNNLEEAYTSVPGEFLGCMIVVEVPGM